VSHCRHIFVPRVGRPNEDLEFCCGDDGVVMLEDEATHEQYALTLEDLRKVLEFAEQTVKEALIF